MEELVNSFDEKFGLEEKLGDQFVEFKHELKQSLEQNLRKIKKDLEENTIKCAAKTRKGHRCKNNPFGSGEFCKKHLDYNPNQVIKIKKLVCNGTKKSGKSCNLGASEKPPGSHNYYCEKHMKNWSKFEESESDSEDDFEHSEDNN